MENVIPFSRKPSEVMKEAIAKQLLPMPSTKKDDDISESEDEGNIQDILENTIINDSGLAGDFPEFSDTDEDIDEESSALDDAVFHNDDDKRDLDYLPSESDHSQSELDSEDSQSDVEKKRKMKSKVKKHSKRAKFDLPDNSVKSNDERKETNTKLPAKAYLQFSEDSTNSQSDTNSQFDVQKKSKKKTISHKRNPAKATMEFPDDSDTEDDVVEVTVPATSKNNEGKRIYDRHHACYYCGQLQSKIGRHLEMKHHDEAAMKDLHDLDKIENKKERDFILDRIRLLGDFYYNVKILKNGGELLVCRRPAPGAKIPASMYGPCKYCYGFYHKEELWRHISRCIYKSLDTNENDLPESLKNVQVEAEILLYGQKDQSYVELEEFVIKRMRKDDITNAATKDSLIMKYGSFLMYGKGSKKANLISNNMRLMGRLLIALRNHFNLPDAPLADLLKPLNFDKIVQCTKDMAGYSQTNDDGELLPSFKTPSLPLKIGFALSSVFMLLKGIGLREKNNDMIEDATNLSQLYSSEWSVHVTSASLRTIADNNFNKKEYLPVTSDLLKIKQHCIKRMEVLTKTVEETADKKDWRELAEIVITRLTIFNKRRGNEVSSILLKRFSNRHEYGKALHDDVLKSMSPLEKKLMERLDLVHVRGKCGKQVPVLLDERSVKAINVLVAVRESMEIPDSNLYLFPAPTKKSKNPLRGYQCMNSVIERVKGLECPESIKSTKLRKYVATVTQISSLNETEIEWLCRHMGHTPEVHKQYYRLQDSAIELSKVSRLLLAVDSGKGASIKGKTLQDINEDDIPDVDLELEDDNENEIENEPSTSTGKARRKRKQWSPTEVQLVNERFRENFKTGKLPKKAECEKVAMELDGRTWSNVKDFIRNKIKKSK